MKRFASRVKRFFLCGAKCEGESSKAENFPDSWRAEAQRIQNQLGRIFGDRVWDRFLIPDQDGDLERRIAIALTGSAGEPSPEQREKTAELKEKCVACCKRQGWDDVLIAFVFVCALQGSTKATVPLIRVKRGDGANRRRSHFVDHFGRVYRNWDTFLKENQFAGAWICVPQDGEYSPGDQDDIRVEFYDQTARGETLKELDVDSSIASIVSSLAMAAGLTISFFPPTSMIGDAVAASSSVLGVPEAVYGAGRSVADLVDRKRHDQSINPFASGEARDSWLTSAASVFSIAALGTSTAASKAAKSGMMFSNGLQVSCTALNATAVSIKGLGVLNAIYEVVKKGKEATTLDIVQLATNIFFFTHTLVDFKTTSDIIRHAQEERIAEFRAETADDAKQSFDRGLRSRRQATGAPSDMQLDKEFIRDLKRVNGVQDFVTVFQLTSSDQLVDTDELYIRDAATWTNGRSE